jgi:ubiquinone biosynthesis protein COQ9
MATTAHGADESLDALRLRLAPAIADAAAFDGWSEQAVVAAAETEGVDPDLARYAFSREGKLRPMAMIGAWVASIDRAMAAEWPGTRLAALPVRERIRALVEFRLDAVGPRVEALRRALAVMASPRHAAESLALGWSSADLMWLLAGDTATDYNHYTKRTILAGIYAATLAAMVEDESAGHADTRLFLGRRIDGIIRFEKAKARLSPPAGAGFSMARFLGRLRYPAR